MMSRRRATVGSELVHNLDAEYDADDQGRAELGQTANTRVGET